MFPLNLYARAWNGTQEGSLYGVTGVVPSNGTQGSEMVRKKVLVREGTSTSSTPFIRMTSSSDGDHVEFYSL